MPPCATCHAQIVQATGDQHNHVRETILCVTKSVFGNPTNLDAGNGMLDSDTRARQGAIVALLARRQFRPLGLFFGCRCSRTRG